MALTSKAIPGLYCRFHRMADATTAPSAATAMAELTSIADPEVTREVASYHVHGDPWERKIVTTLSVPDQDYEATMIGDDASQVALEPLVVSGASAFYAVTYTADANYVNGSIHRFEGFVKSWAVMGALEDQVKVKFSIAVTGKMTLGAI